MGDRDLPDGWYWSTVGELAAPAGRPIVSGPFGSNIGSRFFVERGVPVIRGNNLTADMTRFVDSGFVFVTEQKARELGNVDAVAGDLIFTAAGSIGQVGIIPEDANYPVYVISNKQLRARLNTSAMEPLFAFYWLSSPEMVSHIQQRNTGSSVPLINLSILKSLDVPVPSLNEQRAIIAILGSLDDKIELNRRTNRTLEAIARAIFKAWFIDFEPVKAKAAGATSFPGVPQEVFEQLPDAIKDTDRGPLPEGWESKTLGEVCERPQYGYTASAAEEPVGPKFLRIKDINKLPWVEWKDVPYCRISDEDFHKHRLKRGDIVVARIADPGHGAMVEEDVDAVFASYLIRFRPKNPKWDRYLQYWLKSHQYWQLVAERQTGSTRANLNAKVLSEFPLTTPPDGIIDVFRGQVDPLRKQMIARVVESSMLSVIRDTLLPKLISGELRVPASERSGDGQ